VKVAFIANHSPGSPAGYEPGVLVQDGHFSYRDRGIQVKKRSGIAIRDILFYHVNSAQGGSGLGLATPADIWVNDCYDVTISGCQFSFADYTGGRMGVEVLPTTFGTGDPMLTVTGCNFEGAFAYGVKSTAAKSPYCIGGLLRR